MSVAFVPTGIAVAVISDTRTLEDDRSGAWLGGEIEAAGHHLVARVVIRDEADAIEAQLRAWMDNADISVIITTGGTGLTGRDVSPEAVRRVFDKEIDGFAHVFHRVSFESIGVSTLLSRACAGVAKGTYIFALPGSMGAVRDGWGHILKPLLDNRTRPCNLIEIMSRLEE